MRSRRAERSPRQRASRCCIPSTPSRRCPARAPLALEIEEQVPDVERIVVGCGGGGLYAGLAIALEGRCRCSRSSRRCAPTLPMRWPPVIRSRPRSVAWRRTRSARRISATSRYATAQHNDVAAGAGRGGTTSVAARRFLWDHVARPGRARRLRRDGRGADRPGRGCEPQRDAGRHRLRRQQRLLARLTTARPRSCHSAANATPRHAMIAQRGLAAEDQGALDLLDRLGDLDAARAGLGAVEGGAAAPHALVVVEDLQPLVARPRRGCRR